MIQTIIVADDMTGANVSSSLLAKNGIKVGSLIHLSQLERYKDFEAFGVHTDSRCVEPEEAYARVYNTVQELKQVPTRFFNKRIDSTLRGNLGKEIDGMLDALDNNAVVIVVSAFPNSGKIVVGGYMLVHSQPLEKTDVANDPTSPVTTSVVEQVLKQQTKYQVGSITIETVLKGTEAVREGILKLNAEGCRIISVDASTNEEIDVIASATISSKLPFISVDPGPFTEALVKRLTPKAEVRNKQKILFLIGSVSTIAISQIINLAAVHEPYTVKINAERLIYEELREAEISRVTDEVLANLPDHQMFLVASRIDPEDKLDLAEVARSQNRTLQEISETISSGIAEAGKRIVDRSGEQFGGFYTSGGDTTKAFLAITNTQGIEIKDEIIPLAVYGRIMSGDLGGKAIITKGGLIGDKNTLVQCADYLKNKISAAFFNKEEEVAER